MYFSCVQQRPTVKAPIDVSAMRGMVSIIYNVQQSVTLLNVSNAAQPTPVFASQMRFRNSFSESPPIFSLNSLSVIKPSTRHGARHGRYTVPTSALFAVIFLLRSLALLLQRYCIGHTLSPL